MANIGSLEWAEEKVHNLLDDYNEYIGQARTLQLPVGEVIGRENLKYLRFELEEAMNVLENGKNLFERNSSLEYAEALMKNLDRDLEGLS